MKNMQWIMEMISEGSGCWQYVLYLLIHIPISIEFIILPTIADLYKYFIDGQASICFILKTL